MDEEDAEKTAFITPLGTYCYRVMPFGLKNAGATYMRAMTTVFYDMIHKEIEVYVDDVIIKSKRQANHTGDLRKFFQRLRRFIAQLTTTCEPIFKLLKKDAAIKWTDEYQKAFDEIKGYLSNSHVLVPPEPGRPLILYLTILENSFGCVLGKHDVTGRKEQAIYYLSKKFTAYEGIGKIRGDQQASQSINSVANSSAKSDEKLQLQNLVEEAATQASTGDGYTTEGYNQIKMDPLDEEKTSLITDRGTYCYKVMPFGLKNDGATYQRLVTKIFQEHLRKTMEVYIDDMLVKSQQARDHIQHLSDTFQILRKFNMKLNPEKYAFGVSSGLELARELKIEQVIIKSDLQLIVNQMQGTYIAREARMQQYLEKAWDLVRQFQTWKVTQILREENAEANTLANLASAAEVTNEENASYGILPKYKKKAQALRKKAARYCLDRGNLYRKMFGGPLARCLGPSQTEYVIKEIHEGHCENHVGERSLVKTIIGAGYY
ncbi:uncharacterized protein [Nicotiana sylvestris]|uniref:uncharacterized protein n=1 Tax=Nicotiana sylvestris TaxID=4096 RepID=UPI00388CE7D6